MEKSESYLIGYFQKTSFQHRVELKVIYRRTQVALWLDGVLGYEFDSRILRTGLQIIIEADGWQSNHGCFW